MKQKLISKLKRVALTLFAALCVGSAWADIIPLGENGVDGYIITGLGNNEAAVVFTNHTKNITWTVPANIKDIQFLVVGGGGGGGGGTSRSNGNRLSPGGGGGGGGVATGIIEHLDCGSAFKVKIGNGGSAGPAGTGGGGTGAAGAAGDSSFGVGDFTYITAKAGGSGVGYDRAPDTGASVSGRRYEVGSTAAKLEFGAILVEGAPLSDVYIAPGGASGASGGSTSKRAAGGGGGAMADGGVGSESGGGVGGVGYESSITGQTLVYGSGGGGGGYGIPGGSAGSLNAGAGSTSNNTAGSALANTGGGGGGGGVKSTSERGVGGAGGSGVVVLRFVAQISEEEIRASIKNLPYTGYEQSVLAETDLYSVSGAKQTDIGSYKVKVTPRMGWSWVDGSVGEKEFDWAIVKGINRWVKGPTISSTSWIVGETGNVSLTPTEELEMLVGDEIEVTISKDGATPSVFKALPVDEGKYTLKYKVSGGELYEDFIYTLNFTINNPEIESLPNGVGYKLTGLGLNNDEVAIVFTNHAADIQWEVPHNLYQVEFLVVGGGGAGGADGTNGDKWTGGVGGGGGGVVTGCVANLTAGAKIDLKVGVGGKHGKVAYDPIGNNVNDNGMATAFASNSYFNVDGTVYVTAKAGGSDLGFQNGGQDGGSGAGGRSATATAGKAIASFIIESENVCGKFYGNDGGACGSYSGGGGGGAMTAGVDAGWGFGHGGQGLGSWITGRRVVYGSGGGGGSAANANGGKGGEGAGDGNQVALGAGFDALPNQGGGGGGGGGGEGNSGEAGRGGDGGSGIVVFRYRVYAAEVNSMPYATLAEAIAAAANGSKITVLNDCTADTACVIANKTLTIDLNGKTVKANDTDAATDGNGVFWVQAGGVLTLEDSSEDKSGTVDGDGGNGYKMAIWADGGKVVINAGNYVNDNDGTHDQYDLIYAKNGGEIVINGGTFKCDTPRWTLNSHNTKSGTFVVTGGKFYQYNPTDFDTDEAVTTWCDAKYRAEADGDWYVIKEGYTVTEESAATVTADTEAEALAQVDFSVITPEGVDAEKYNDYFKLVATETAEGSKTWTVALALKDEVKPVIAETTNDDGTVTPAITFNEDGTVTVNIENELPGLNYGVRYATDVEAVDAAEIVPGFTVTPDEGNTAGFFKVVVDFKEIQKSVKN